jgi:hypothetical protein
LTKKKSSNKAQTIRNDETSEKQAETTPTATVYDDQSFTTRNITQTVDQKLILSKVTSGRQSSN